MNRSSWVQRFKVGKAPDSGGNRRVRYVFVTTLNVELGTLNRSFQELVPLAGGAAAARSRSVVVILAGLGVDLAGGDETVELDADIAEL